MLKYFDTDGRPVMIQLDCRSTKPIKIRIKCYGVTEKNVEIPQTFFTNRYAVINSKDRFYIKIPVSTNRCALECYNENYARKSNDKDTTFEVTDLKKVALPTRLFCFAFQDATTAQFTQFAEEFALRAGVLSPGIYYSNNSKFRIDFMDTLPGASASTPARISADTAVVEVCRPVFQSLSVPGRICILLHEFCHFFQNADIRDEEEADYNAIKIYLGKGYPSVEALLAYMKVFDKANNSRNDQRYARIKAYVENFEGTIKRKNAVTL